MERELSSDDIARLRQRLGEGELHYQDISREAELLEVCRRWPLLAESEGWNRDGDSLLVSGRSA
ncbi:cellulose biosynthesis protein BcsR [Aquipseudomonas alcaligenes]|uniref:cellulose biosynthesis protein BcsR n=1 Tax=Aquipseudomonas alcaligenes TaxID=43263 RepID=UPI003748F833